MRSSDRAGTRAIPATMGKISNTNSKRFMITFQRLRWIKATNGLGWPLSNPKNKRAQITHNHDRSEGRSIPSKEFPVRVPKYVIWKLSGSLRSVGIMRMERRRLGSSAFHTERTFRAYCAGHDVFGQGIRFVITKNLHQS